MVPKRELTPDEERRCVEFLRVLRITDPDHRVLSERGFFGLYLTGLTPEEVDRSAPPAVQEFRETIRLLCLAGVERLRELVREDRARRTPSTSSTAVPKLPAGRPSGELPRPAIVPVPLPGRDALRPVAPSPRGAALPRPGSSQTTVDLSGASSRGAATTQGISPSPEPPAREPERPPSSADHVAPLTRSSLVAFSSPGKADTRGGTGSSDILMRPTVGKPIQAVRPSHDDIARLGAGGHVETIAEAVAKANEHVARREFHEAYHALVDYLLTHQLHSEVLQAATDVVFLAGKWNRARNIAPTNMLHECEEMAAVLSRRIPNMTKLCESDNDETTRLYRYTKLVYFTWTSHCQTLLEYKYHSTDDMMVRRNWVEPRDFGFLLDVMKMGIRSRLPLDLLRSIFAELRKCIEVGKRVVAQTDKRAKFEGDVLRIVASPVKDEVPDLAFEIYREIAKAYGVEGDSQSSLIFVRQALLLRPSDAEMLLLKATLEKGRKS